MEGLGGYREHLQDTDGVNESFWDGHGVEIEARQLLTFRHDMRCRHIMTRCHVSWHDDISSDDDMS